MWKRTKIRFGECVYCGNTRPITDDHIPPKNLFPKPRPNDLITVPSCYPCNNEASLDDEYFRMMLIMRHDTATHVAAKQNWDTVLRGLKKPEQEGLKRSLLKSISRTLVQTPAGLIIPGATYEVDLQRLANVGSRITAGLFFRERSYRLPDTYKIETHPDPFFTHDDPLKLMQSLSPVLESSPKRIGNGVFTYWRGFVAEDEKMSMWLMLFFDSFSFVSLTAPIEDVG